MKCRAKPAALPAPPHGDAVQRVSLQFMVVREQIHCHLIPLGPTEPGDHDALGPEWRRPFLFDALPAPRTPHAIHPLGTQAWLNPGLPPDTELVARLWAAALRTASSSTCYPHSKPPPHQQPMGECDPDASLPPTVSAANRNARARADQTTSCGNGLSDRKCSFLKAIVPAASIQPQGSANFLVANGILSQTRRDTSGLQEEF